MVRLKHDPEAVSRLRQPFDSYVIERMAGYFPPERARVWGSPFFPSHGPSTDLGGLGWSTLGFSWLDDVVTHRRMDDLVVFKGRGSTLG